MNPLILNIETLGPWHMGSGEPGERDLDAVVSLDADGLPWIPGKTLKGLLREASLLAEDFTRVPAGWTTWAFGAPDGIDNLRGSGALDFRAARLPESFRSWWSSQDEPQSESLRSAFFHDYASTAINEHGIADDNTLRRVESVIPVTLEATVSLRPGATTRDDDWQAIFTDTVLPLVRRLGSHRTRGWGRCHITKKEVRP